MALEVLLHAIVDRHGHDKRRDSGRNTGNRDQGDNREKSLFALCPEVAFSDEKLKGHLG